MAHPANSINLDRAAATNPFCSSGLQTAMVFRRSIQTTLFS
jgi:hypothetical protein